VSRGSRVTRVTGQLTDGSRGSLVKKCDPLSSLEVVMLQSTTSRPAGRSHDSSVTPGCRAAFSSVRTLVEASFLMCDSWMPRDVPCSATPGYRSTCSVAPLPSCTSSLSRSTATGPSPASTTFTTGVIALLSIINTQGGSVAEWLACWTQVQQGLGSNGSHEAVR